MGSWSSSFKNNVNTMGRGAAQHRATLIEVKMRQAAVPGGPNHSGRAWKAPRRPDCPPPPFQRAPRACRRRGLAAAAAPPHRCSPCRSATWACPCWAHGSYSGGQRRRSPAQEDGCWPAPPNRSIDHLAGPCLCCADGPSSRWTQTKIRRLWPRCWGSSVAQLSPRAPNVDCAAWPLGMAATASPTNASTVCSASRPLPCRSARRTWRGGWAAPSTWMAHTRT